jgi:hypothetical protein
MNTFMKATITAVSLMAATSAYAGDNFEKIDIVKEGIDITDARVRANSNGYTGYETDKHTFLVRVFAKGKGNKNIFAAGIGNKAGMSLIEVTPGDWLFDQYTPPGDDGWGVYKKSIVLKTKLSKVEWFKSPIQACKENLQKQMAQGKTKAWVLNREWSVQAHALIRFYAGAAPKNSIKKRHFYDGGQTRQDNIAYPVNVKCREAL